MATLLEQIEALDFEDREKLVIAINKVPEKTSEEIMITEMKDLRNEFTLVTKSISSQLNILFMMLIMGISLMYMLLNPKKTLKI